MIGVLAPASVPCRDADSCPRSLAHLFPRPLEARVEVAQDLPLPRVTVGREVLGAGRRHVDQVAAGLLQQQPGEQGLGSGGDRQSVRHPGGETTPPRKTVSA